MSVVDERPHGVAVKPACEAVGASRATWYRRRKAAAAPPAERPPRRPHPRRIPDADRARILETLCSERFADETPRIVHARLLDEGRFLCSTRTMYRILAEHGASRGRRGERSRRRHEVPRLVATAPGQVWTWDCTKLPSFPAHVCLYVAIDLYSRHVVGWTVSRTESAAAAINFLRDAARREGIGRGRLVIHSDRGSPMTSQSLGGLLEELGIRRSHSRPRVSDDNPYSESHFKTLKHGPIWPGRRLGIHEWERWCRDAIEWYVNRPHEGLAFFTPAPVHRGEHRSAVVVRQRTLDEAYRMHPERFVRGRPHAAMPPAEVWINRPPDDEPERSEAKRAAANAANAIAIRTATTDCTERATQAADSADGTILHDTLLRSSGGMRAREHSDARRLVDHASSNATRQAPRDAEHDRRIAARNQPHAFEVTKETVPQLSHWD